MTRPRNGFVQCNVTIPESLMDELRGAADLTNRSLRDVVVCALDQYLQPYRDADDLRTMEVTA